MRALHLCGFVTSKNKLQVTLLRAPSCSWDTTEMSFEERGKKTVAVGPWGGQDGYRWDDGVYSTVRQMVIAHGAGIDSLQIEYDMKGSSIWSERHGGNGGSKVDKRGIAPGTEKVGYSILQGSIGQNFDIVLAVKQKEDQSYPFGSKISRQTSGCRELTEVEASKKIPEEEKVPQKFPKQEKVPQKIENSVKLGPWGGSGGTSFDDGVYTGIRQIILSRNVAIASIKVLYDWNGEAIWGSKQGSAGGFKSDKIVFDYPNEILTHITGTHEPLIYKGPTIIRSITFHTNKGKHGPFGEEQGGRFTSKEKEGKIVGFHGRSGLFMDALGVYLREGKVSPAVVPPSGTNSKNDARMTEDEYPPWSSKLGLPKQGPKEEVAHGVIKETVPCGPGPWGGDGGQPWDDGVFSGIKQIYITRDEAICSIQIEYDRNGQSVWSVKHGSNSGTVMHRIKLEHPNEVLICVSGYYGPINKDERSSVIRSLTLSTSRGKYGPYGKELGTFFTSTTTEGKVVGFHGRSGLYLDAIGVHMQHWLGNQSRPKSSILKMFY